MADTTRWRDQVRNLFESVAEVVRLPEDERAIGQCVLVASVQGCSIQCHHVVLISPEVKTVNLDHIARSQEIARHVSARFTLELSLFPPVSAIPKLTLPAYLEAAGWFCAIPGAETSTPAAIESTMI